MEAETAETVQFDKNVKPLFRDKDRASMLFRFDLWSYEDVKQHSKFILDRITAGSMPCDGAWPPKKVNIFRTWMEDGMPK